MADSDDLTEDEFISAARNKYGFELSVLILRNIFWYARHRKPGGHFIKELMCNRLIEAFQRADMENQKHMANFVNVIVNMIPSISHGSELKYNAWLSR